MKEKFEEIDPRDSEILSQDTIDKIRKLFGVIVSDNIAKAPIAPKGIIATDLKMFATEMIPGSGIIYWLRKLLFTRSETVRLILKIGDSTVFEDFDAVIFQKCLSFEDVVSILKDYARLLVYKSLY